MRATTEPVRQVWTEAELQSLPEDGFIHEVVDGELVMSPKNDFFHGSISVRLSAALLMHAEANHLGEVLDSSAGFWMKNRNCRAPDISFITAARLKDVGFKRATRRFFPGAPDLAVEILSPNNSRREMDRRLKDFFESGARMVWIIDPEAEHVEVCRSLIARELVGAGGFLEAEDLLPGFRYPIADLFRVGGWE
jgi:Uma2 family endonuclease